MPTACAKRDALLSQLANRYGEVPVAIGVADGRLVELLTAKDGITWTIGASAADNNWSSVTYGGPTGSSLFVAVASSGTNRVMTSATGT